MSSPSWWGRYEEGEVLALVENYLSLRYLRHRPAIHVRIMDLEVALGYLPRKLFEAVLVLGILRFSDRAGGEALHITHTAAAKRYRQGLEQMLLTMNGDR